MCSISNKKIRAPKCQKLFSAQLDFKKVERGGRCGMQMSSILNNMNISSFANTNIIIPYTQILPCSFLMCAGELGVRSEVTAQNVLCKKTRDTSCYIEVDCCSVST